MPFRHRSSVLDGTALALLGAVVLASLSCEGWDNIETLAGGGDAGAGNPTGGGGNGGGPECAAPSDCPATDACIGRTCNDGSCGTSLLAKGALCDEDGGTVCDGAGTCVVWADVSPDGAPSPRSFHTAVWTGEEMIVWGGRPGPNMVVNTGGRYDPATDSWTATSLDGAPAARHSHRAIWTGSVMVVWGGFGQAGYEPAGGVYDPATDSWTAMSTSGQPAGRTHHVMVWTGSEVIVWGGLITVNPQGDGRRYSVTNDSWTPMGGFHDARFSTSYAWAEPSTPHLPNGGVIVWGGSNTFDWLNDGRIYDPVANNWLPMSTAGAPPAPPLESTSSVFVTDTMYMFGGWDGGTYFNEGYLYEPGAQAGGFWTTIDNAGAPSPRTNHVAVVPAAGTMMVWGGCSNAGCIDMVGDGGIWRDGPGGGAWTAVPVDPLLSPRRDATGVWTGSEVIIWGGRSGSSAFGDGARRGIATR